MRKSADAVVIGGGSIGCSAAYHLAKKGFRRVVLVEKRYLTSGSTGRCAAGIRQQWGTEMNCLLSRGSAALFQALPEELGCGDVEFRQSGYLLVTYEESQARMLEENLELQHRLGIGSRKLSPQEAREVVPFLRTEGMVAAFFGPEDGHINPFKATFAYARAARRLGAEIHPYTTVTGLKTAAGRIAAVETDRGTVETPLVVNATGPYAKTIGAMLGLYHPVEPERHQILITEPMEPTLGPLVMSFHHDSYCQQVPHGGFIMGYGNPNEPKGFNYAHDWRFLEDIARKITDQMPVLRDLRVVRQWAGHYGISPDAQPILGPIPEVEGYYLALGCGKGFMLSPMIGRLTAELLAGEETSLPIEALSVERFDRGELIVEPAVV
ncbi:MAG: FAD-binding oxidoreductase [Deferrisomatales bacterium]